MPKPILAITIPYAISKLHKTEIQKHLTEQGVDREYWCFILPADVQSSSIQVFFEKDFNQVKYDELKTIIEQIIK